jgi:hypothetical protein
VQIFNFLFARKTFWRGADLGEFWLEHIEVGLEELIHLFEMRDSQLHRLVNKSVSFDRVFLGGHRAVHDKQLVRRLAVSELASLEQ